MNPTGPPELLQPIRDQNKNKRDKKLWNMLLIQLIPATHSCYSFIVAYFLFSLITAYFPGKTIKTGSKSHLKSTSNIFWDQRTSNLHSLFQGMESPFKEALDHYNRRRSSRERANQHLASIHHTFKNSSLSEMNPLSWRQARSSGSSIAPDLLASWRMKTVRTSDCIITEVVRFIKQNMRFYP